MKVRFLVSAAIVPLAQCLGKCGKQGQFLKKAWRVTGFVMRAMVMISATPSGIITEQNMTGTPGFTEINIY